MSSPRPHYMATKLDPPCVQCGYDWQRPTIDTSDPTLEEWPLVSVCARCKHRVTPPSLVPAPTTNQREADG